jgi:hypothetical protein
MSKLSSSLLWVAACCCIADASISATDSTLAWHMGSPFSDGSVAISLCSVWFGSRFGSHRIVTGSDRRCEIALGCLELPSASASFRGDTMQESTAQTTAATETAAAPRSSVEASPPWTRTRCAPCARREEEPPTRMAEPIASIPKKRRGQARKAAQPSQQTEPTWPPSASAAAKPRKATESGKPPDAKPSQRGHHLTPSERHRPLHQTIETDRLAERLTPITSHVSLRITQHDIAALARPPNHPRRSPLDPHPPLRYAIHHVRQVGVVGPKRSLTIKDKG